MGSHSSTSITTNRSIHRKKIRIIAVIPAPDNQLFFLYKKPKNDFFLMCSDNLQELQLDMSLLTTFATDRFSFVCNGIYSDNSLFLGAPYLDLFQIDLNGLPNPYVVHLGVLSSHDSFAIPHPTPTRKLLMFLEGSEMYSYSPNLRRRRRAADLSSWKFIDIGFQKYFSTTCMCGGWDGNFYIVYSSETLNLTYIRKLDPGMKLADNEPIARFHRADIGPEIVQTVDGVFYMTSTSGCYGKRTIGVLALYPNGELEFVTRRTRVNGTLSLAVMASGSVLSRYIERWTGMLSFDVLSRSLLPDFNEDLHEEIIYFCRLHLKKHFPSELSQIVVEFCDYQHLGKEEIRKLDFVFQKKKQKM